MKQCSRRNLAVMALAAGLLAGATAMALPHARCQTHVAKRTTVPFNSGKKTSLFFSS